ncbi:MAG: prepilin peptidase [Candidatus Eremiobacteraeota bacterium]|nr:prepilin peptidase [Candidatus Eremiobacteraeota bacterium]
MVESLLTALVGALIFGTAGLCGLLLAMVVVPRLKALPDGPAPMRVHPAVLVAGAALLGGILGFKRLPNPEFIIEALTVIPLVAIWYCDALTGIVPDVFTLIPLGLALIYELILKQPMAFASAAVLFIVFGAFAFFSKGRGMGWGDAKLAAFGGAMLGMKDATLAFGVAALAAVIVASVRHRSKPVPIAFAPYLVLAMAVTMAIASR